MMSKTQRAALKRMLMRRLDQLADQRANRCLTEDEYRAERAATTRRLRETQAEAKP